MPPTVRAAAGHNEQSFISRVIRSVPVSRAGACLFDVVSRSTVRLRGWDFPHYGRLPFSRLKNSIEVQESWQYYREVWRFYQSGQFIYVIGIHEDWAEFAPGWSAPPDVLAEGRLLGTGDTVMRITETYEFASRLGQEIPGSDPLVIAIELHGAKDRRLWLEDSARSFSQLYRADDDLPPFEQTYDRMELLADPDSLALLPMKSFFSRFGWNASDAVLRSLQPKR
jgi:hypothetical protein